jgi:hypothetical protein
VLPLKKVDRECSIEESSLYELVDTKGFRLEIILGLYPKRPVCCVGRDETEFTVWIVLFYLFSLYVVKSGN